MNSDSAPRRGKAWKIAAAILILVILGAGAGAYWYIWMRGIVSTDDARIDGDLVDIAPQISGVIDSILFAEGEPIKNGDVLFRLDSRKLGAALEVARADLYSASAELAVAQATYELAKNGPRPREIKIAEAAQKQAAAQAQLAESDWQRAQELFAQQTLSKSELDKARTARDSATEALHEASENLSLLREGTRTEEVAAARSHVDECRADVLSKAAAVNEARVALSDATITAPFDGIVARKWRSPGATVSVGTPVLTLFNPASLYVSANVEERDLEKVEVGDPVDIAVDAYGGASLRGRVARILRATNSQFSLIPAEGVSGTFIKVSQRVPLNIELLDEPELVLSPGLSVEVRIHVADSQSIPVRQARND